MMLKKKKLTSSVTSSVVREEEGVKKNFVTNFFGTKIRNIRVGLGVVGVSALIMTVLLVGTIFFFRLGQPKIVAENTNVMQLIDDWNDKENAVSFLLIGLIISNFLLLTWMRYAKIPPAEISRRKT